MQFLVVSLLGLLSPAPANAAGEIAPVHLSSSSSDAKFGRHLVTQTSPATRLADGNYQGPIADAYYGDVEVQAIVQNGQLASVRPRIPRRPKYLPIHQQPGAPDFGAGGDSGSDRASRYRDGSDADQRSVHPIAQRRTSEGHDWNDILMGCGRSQR